MPELFEVKDLLNGLNTDISPWALPPNAITSGINFRIADGAIKTSGGSITTSTSSTTFTPGYVLAVNSPTSVSWLMPGLEEVMLYNGTAWFNLSSWAGTPLNSGDELLWTGCSLGKFPIINNPQHTPEYWDQNTGNPMQSLPWDAAQNWDAVSKHCTVMRSHKNFLFALNLQEGADILPDAYRWSHPADINGLPYTWDENDASALAGRAQLGGDSGAIIDGLTLRDSFVIYSQNGINVLDYTGGEFVWRRRKLTTTFGLFAKNCVVEANGVHYFIADGDIVQNDGNSVVSILHHKLRQRLTANASSSFYNRSFVVRNDTLNEIWFCVPEDGAEFPNVAYVYNWIDGTWSLRTLPENLSAAAFGPTEFT